MRWCRGVVHSTVGQFQHKVMMGAFGEIENCVQRGAAVGWPVHGRIGSAAKPHPQGADVGVPTARLVVGGVVHPMATEPGGGFQPHADPGRAPHGQHPPQQHESVRITREGQRFATFHDPRAVTQRDRQINPFS